MQPYVVLILMFLFGTARAQSGAVDLDDLFHDPDSVQWVKQSTGLMEGLFPVELVIGYDGHVYRGAFHYSKNADPTILSGNVRNGRIKLEELDDNGKLTGFVEGAFEDTRFVGSWISSDRSRRYELNLLEKKLIELKPFKPRFEVISGNFGSEYFVANLAIESPSLVSGVIEFNGEYIRIIGECEDKDCASMMLYFLEGNGVGGKININRSGDKGLVVRFSGENGSVQSAVAERRATGSIDLRTASDFGVLIDQTQIITGVAGVDDMIRIELSEWQEGLLQNHNSQSADRVPNRWGLRASAWMDIYHWSEAWVTGLLTMYDPHSAVYTGEIFMYDLQNERAFELADLARDEEALLSSLKEMAGFESEVYPIPTRLGFEVRSAFDAVTGSRGVLVPYEEVSSFIKKKAVLNKLSQ